MMRMSEGWRRVGGGRQGELELPSCSMPTLHNVTQHAHVA